MAVEKSKVTYLQESKESLFPLEYYAQVQGTVESMLAAANSSYDIDTIEEVFSMLQHFLMRKS